MLKPTTGKGHEPVLSTSPHLEPISLRLMLMLAFHLLDSLSSEILK
jgi:hypothetical protein